MAEAEAPPGDKVGDIAARCVLTAGETDSLWKARGLMTHGNVSRLVIIDEGSRPLGVVSKRDVARFLLEDSTSRGLQEIGVGEVCTHPVRMISSESSVSEAARILSAENLACAVVSEDDVVSGIVTDRDLCQYFSRGSSGGMKVSDFMTTDFFFAKSNYPIVHVAHALVFRQPTVPVIDEKLVGILTLTDLLSMNENMLVSSDPDRAILMMARDLMTPNPITISEATELTQAAKVIADSRKSSLPVINLESRVVGLLTAHNIVKAMASTGPRLVELTIENKREIERLRKCGYTSSLGV
jgi:CBS domain-containing protein